MSASWGAFKSAEDGTEEQSEDPGSQPHRSIGSPPSGRLWGGSDHTLNGEGEF